MSHVRVDGKVIQDETGMLAEMPVILIATPDGAKPLEPLVDFLLAHHAKSRSWMNKVCQSVGLLLEYLAANDGNFERAEDLFDVFAQRVSSGTIGEDGRDPSCLYWLPKSTANARQLLTLLSDFSDWMHKNLGARQLNPWREATTYEQKLNWAAFINHSQRSFLGHLDAYAVASAVAKQARNTRLRRVPRGDLAGVKAFPEDKFQALLFEGFKVPGRQNSLDVVERYDWRGICITLLQHHGGLRDCEPFHIWVHDVMPDPLDPSLALVRVYHPIDGAAPKDFRGPDGRFSPNRQAYLAARHPGYLPRHRASGNYHAGWKNPKMSDATQQYMHVHWFPRDSGRLFLQAWKLYMFQRLRAKIGADKHPFLFVSFRGAQSGEPYTIDAFRDAHERAVRRIGLVSAKMNGTTEHGHRHAYGRRAERANLGSAAIQSGLHHASMESQQVYTEPTIERVTTALTAATEALSAGQSLSMVMDLETVVSENEITNNRLRSKWRA